MVHRVTTKLEPQIELYFMPVELKKSKFDSDEERTWVEDYIEENKDVIAIHLIENAKCPDDIYYDGVPSPLGRIYFGIKLDGMNFRTGALGDLGNRFSVMVLNIKVFKECE